MVRQKDLEHIVELIRENGQNNCQHILFVAPRGFGKTTLALRVASEIRKSKEFSENWYPVVFSEESYEICTPGEFWLEAIFHIGKQTQDMRWQNVYEELRTESKEDRLRDRALAQLMDFADERNVRLMLVVENMNMLLGQQISSDDAWKLRHTLMSEPRIMVLGTATSRFDQLDNSENALFELFKINKLEPLNTDECQILWESITGQQLSWNRIRPIGILTGGSPRLLVIISGFIVKNSLKELMENLTGLVDEHTEYFKSHLDRLPPQERKVFVTLADTWNPATASVIAKYSRISVNSVSSNLQRLISRGAVVVAPEKSRKKWYQVAERMYNIYHLLRRRGEAANRVRAVVDFIIYFYIDDDLVKLTRTVAEEACSLEPKIREDHCRFIEEIIKIPKVLKFREKIIDSIPEQLIGSLKLPHDLIKQMGAEEAKEKISANELTEGEIETGTLKEPNNLSALLQLSLKIIENPNRIEEAEKACRKAIELDPKYAFAWICLGYLLSKKPERFDEAENAIERATELAPSNLLIWEYLIDFQFSFLKNPEKALTAGNEYLKASMRSGQSLNRLAWLVFKNDC